ncbi:MAG: PepSY-like domain-containing protein [Saprospiraceae bacterium]|uniref:PepSY-like domain-containing protein n=1 Tax=Candidatus Defluviibacterium haderslevense TaxID=2981993 RepID=A0A9D7S9U3_9BACT|nr:PepSY-like domain-containing protein [Candidatus Defluviibacterium haderslevense]
MKSIIFSCAIILAISSTVHACPVPEKAKIHFKTNHPGAQKVHWSKDDGEFEVEFKESGKNMSCSYDKGGMLLETETEITIQELPAHIKEAVNKAYPNYNIEDIEEVSIPNAGIQYEMELELGKIEFEVLVSGDGTSITKKSD